MTPEAVGKILRLALIFFTFWSCSQLPDTPLHGGRSQNSAGISSDEVSVPDHSEREYRQVMGTEVGNSKEVSGTDIGNGREHGFKLVCARVSPADSSQTLTTHYFCEIAGDSQVENPVWFVSDEGQNVEIRESLDNPAKIDLVLDGSDVEISRIQILAHFTVNGNRLGLEVNLNESAPKKGKDEIEEKTGESPSPQPEDKASVDQEAGVADDTAPAAAEQEEAAQQESQVSPEPCSGKWTAGPEALGFEDAIKWCTDRQGSLADLTIGDLTNSELPTNSYPDTTYWIAGWNGDNYIERGATNCLQVTYRTVTETGCTGLKAVPLCQCNN